MTVIEFPTAVPTTQKVLEAAYAVAASRREWSLACRTAESGQPYVEAVHRVLNTTFGFHWKPSQWAAIDENGTVVTEGASLLDLMMQTLS